MFGCRRQDTARHMDDAGRVFDRDELLAGLLEILFSAAEARQDQRLLAGDQVRAIQLRRDLDGQPAAGERFGGVIRVRRRGEEVSAERDEDLYLPLVHSLDGADDVAAMLSRRREVELLAQR